MNKTELITSVIGSVVVGGGGLTAIVNATNPIIFNACLLLSFLAGLVVLMSWWSKTFNQGSRDVLKLFASHLKDTDDNLSKVSDILHQHILEDRHFQKTYLAAKTNFEANDKETFEKVGRIEGQVNLIVQALELTSVLPTHKIPTLPPSPAMTSQRHRGKALSKKKEAK